MRRQSNVWLPGLLALLLVPHSGIAPDTGSAAVLERVPSEHRNHPQEVYVRADIDSYPLPRLGERQRHSLDLQKRMLASQRNGRKHFNIGGLEFSRHDMARTVNALQYWGSSALVPLSEYCDVYRISGKDGKGSVLFTGYYSPILEVRNQPDEVFKYPIYGKPAPMPTYPTRRQIHKEWALDGQGLELAYAKSLLDIQLMQIQGSGYVQYEDGSRHLFSYGGNNNHPRKSITEYFQDHYALEGRGARMSDVEQFIRENPEHADDIIYHNPSYVFFVKNPAGKKATGAGNVPLEPFTSVATDKRYIPTGTCLMASRPTLERKSARHEMSLLLAQDVGSGVKGPGHVDVYTGVGETAREATRSNSYGKLWLLLAKQPR